MSGRLEAGEVRLTSVSEIDNICAALRRGVEHTEETTVRIAAALWRFWHLRPDLFEGLEQAIAEAREG